MVFNANSFLSLGLDIGGHDHWRNHQHNRNVEEFVKFTGVHPESCTMIWNALVARNLIDNIAAQPKHLILALRFLKAYDYEHELANMFVMSARTVRKWVRYFVVRLSELKSEVVSVHRFELFVVAKHALTLTYFSFLRWKMMTLI